MKKDEIREILNDTEAELLDFETLTFSNQTLSDEELVRSIVRNVMEAIKINLGIYDE